MTPKIEKRMTRGQALRVLAGSLALVMLAACGKKNAPVPPKPKQNPPPQ